jgi:transcriptional regulator with XRE-family HTH domain
MNFFAQNIQFLRKEKGLTQAQTADIIGVKRNTWSNYETNISQPDMATIIEISKYFDISLDALILSDLSESVQGMDRKGDSKKINKSSTKSTGVSTDSNPLVTENHLVLLLEAKEQLIRSLQATIDTQMTLISVQNQQITVLSEECTRLKRAIQE